MGFNNSISAGFFLLIIITGGFTTITDLYHKKIRNSHLIVIALAAVIFIIVKGLSDHLLPMLQLSSTACAIIIAWVFYKIDLWRGGDAKLFVLFSLLMPATGYESRIFFPSIALFVNTFIIALIFLGLLFFKDFMVDPKSVTENILKVLKEIRIGRVTAMTLAMTFCVTWMIFPLFQICGLTKYGVPSFLSIYIALFFIRKNIERLINNKVFIIMVFAGGLFLHYKFSPDFFLWKNILVYLNTVVIYSFCAQGLYGGTICITKSNERVPFAPFLFLGCLSSYTPFLYRIMSLLHPGK